MLRICEFFGMVVYMYYDDHRPIRTVGLRLRLIRPTGLPLT